METIIYLILIGIAAGFLGGMVGVGGGIIIVPALVLLLGISQNYFGWFPHHFRALPRSSNVTSGKHDFCNPCYQRRSAPKMTVRDTRSDKEHFQNGFHSGLVN